MSKRAYSPKCSNCGQRTMAVAAIPYSTKVSHDGREYEVSIPALTVPKCTSCNQFVLDDEANKQIDRAFRQVANLLTPEEIRDGIDSLGITQIQLADEIGIAASTLSRWVQGAQIQQRSLNRIMKAYFRDAQVRRLYAAMRAEEENRPALVAQSEEASAEPTP